MILGKNHWLMEKEDQNMGLVIVGLIGPPFTIAYQTTCKED